MTLLCDGKWLVVVGSGCGGCGGCGVDVVWMCWL
jgi:hypothetical protein